MDKNKQQIINPGLYLVSTPIGNLDDITFRAINILKQSNMILCEDTRKSKKLLNYFGIKNKLIAYHKFNEHKISTMVTNYIKKNNIVSLISDAGTPAVSDPGLILIKKCIDEKINIYPIPGASAVTSAISVSGFSDKYLFYGFLTKKEKELDRVLKSLLDLDYSIVFFIPASKISFYITKFKNFFTDRKILIAKEMTKIHENFIRGEINSIKYLPENLKGEFTVVISEKNKDKNIKKKIDESVKIEINPLRSSTSDILNLASVAAYSSDIIDYKKNKKNIIILLILILLSSCVGSSTSGVFGSGVSIALDPRTLGTQIDDSIMQKNLQARLVLNEKKYLVKVSVKVLDGRIFLGGKVDGPEEKLKITKMAWETKGVRSVKNNIAIKQKFSIKKTAIDVLITSQLRTAIILNKNIKAANFNIDTVNQKTYVFGIAHTEDEKKEIINEAKQIVDLKELVTSILLVSDLSRQKE